MPALSEPVPIVLIGIHTEMGIPVSQKLLPEYEVIRFVQSLAAARADLPHLLAGAEPPAPPTNEVGTHRYGRPARAVLLGRAFSPEQAAELRRECAGAGAPGPPVLWIAGDPARKPSAGAQGEGRGEGERERERQGPPPGYDDVVARLAKGALGRWREEGAARGDLVLY